MKITKSLLKQMIMEELQQEMGSESGPSLEIAKIVPTGRTTFNAVDENGKTLYSFIFDKNQGITYIKNDKQQVIRNNPDLVNQLYSLMKK